MGAIENRTKSYKNLKESGNIGTIDLVRDLVTAMMEMAREANDVAIGEDVYSNQGRIALCKELLETYLKFNP